MEFGDYNQNPGYGNQQGYEGERRPSYGGVAGGGGYDAGARGDGVREVSRLGFSRAGAQKNKKGLLGLSNLGNTCFMNSALQCLTHTHGLQKYFRWCSHAYTSKGQSSRQKLLMSFAHWFERDWGKNVSAQYHSPEDILRSVQSLNPIFQGYAQQDSQEFLRCVLDNMHEELRREVPDDLHGHLQRCFGIEAPDGGTESGASSSGLSAASARSNATAAVGHGTALGPEDESRQSAGGALGKAPPSTTRQFMQLCQSTEGVTDAGEIRLPTNKASPAPHAPNKISGYASDHMGGAAAGPSDPAALRGGQAASAVSGDGVEDGPWAPAETRGDKASLASEESTTCPSSSSTAGNPEKKDEDEVKTHFSSIVSELFQGRVVSIVRCLECQKTSRTEEVIYDVSVPIPNPNEMGMRPDNVSDSGMKGPSWSGMLGGIPGKVKNWFYDKGVDLNDCFSKYCAPEYLTGKDKYFCEHCKRKNDGEKRIVFKELPEVLCIHLKRFRYDASWFNGTKNSRVVTFPVTRCLDLSSFLDESPQQPVEYRLVGMIQHIGSMGGGHYISYCQHKRKPQDWYEFDDMRVSVVSADQVERAEPYVLFCQRVVSKGTKRDRQTFKDDQRRTQAQIRAYLTNHPSSPSGAPKPYAGGGRGSDSRADAAADEMRYHGPALRNLYRAPPSELDVVFVSKHWYVRLTTMSQPGPIDNFEYLCPHQKLGASSVEMAAEPFIPISRNMFQSLVQKYGGGPCIHALDICPKCQTYLRAYNERKQAEFDLVSKHDTKDTGDGKAWYLVDALWVNNWKRYVKSEIATDIRDMCAPGPVTNERLYDKENPRLVRANLRLRIDYIGVNARVWWLFMHVHGGGPAICREDLDIYSEESCPETELGLDELRGKNASDLARRISRQFVDECHGNMELYERKYGSGVGRLDTDVQMVSHSEPGSPERGGGDRDAEMRDAPIDDCGGQAEDPRSGLSERRSQEDSSAREDSSDQ